MLLTRREKPRGSLERSFRAASFASRSCNDGALFLSDAGSARYIFADTPDCEVVHGALYACLRALFGLSVIGILVSLFSGMLVYQLLGYAPARREKTFYKIIDADNKTGRRTRPGIVRRRTFLFPPFSLARSLSRCSGGIGPFHSPRDDD